MIINKLIYGILIATLPVVVMMPPKFMLALYFMLAVFGFFEFLREKYFKLKATNIYFGYLFLFYFISLFVHALRVDEVPRLFYIHSGEYFFLLAPLVCYSLSRASNLAVNWYIDSCKVVISLVFIWVIFRLIDQNFFGRVLWHSQLGAILLSISWCSIYKESSAKYMVTIFITLLGVIAIAYSGTRTALLMLSFLNIFIVFYYLIYKKSFMKIIWLFFIVQSSILLSIFSLSLLRSRFKNAVDVVVSTPTSMILDSTSIRLQIYKKSFEVGFENFFTGYGYLDPISIIRPHMNEILFHSSSGHTYLHNSYLDNFLIGGALQLIFLLIILFIIYHFFISIKFVENDFQIKVMALTLLVAYSLAGSFESMLVGTYECGFLVLTLCLLSSRKVAC